MYHDFLGREIEDLEGDNMRRDAIESRKEQPGPVLLICSCNELGKHGNDCYNVETPDGEIVNSHITYTAAYKQIYGEEPPVFDPCFDMDD